MWGTRAAPPRAAHIQTLISTVVSCKVSWISMRMRNPRTIELLGVGVLFYQMMSGTTAAPPHAAQIQP